MGDSYILIFQYLQAHKQPGDVVYSRADWRQYLRDLQQVRGYPRVWLFFSHAYSEEAFFVEYLDRIGKRLDLAQDERASVYLYDLR